LLLKRYFVLRFEALLPEVLTCLLKILLPSNLTAGVFLKPQTTSLAAFRVASMSTMGLG
jgi:hypothetical protein